MALLLAVLGCTSPEGVIDPPPVANAGRDLRVFVEPPEEVFVELDGFSSRDAEGDGLTFEWSFVTGPAELRFIQGPKGPAHPLVGLSQPGLYLLKLVVHDGDAPSAPDFLNLRAVLPPAPAFDQGLDVGLDSGPLDLGLDLGVDAGPEVAVDAAADLGADLGGELGGDLGGDGSSAPEAGVDTGLDAQPDQGPDAPFDDQPPTPIIDGDRRVRLGEPIRLNAARSQDDRGPLRYRWRLVRGPFGADVAFERQGVALEYLPPAAGRYTLRVEVSDGLHEVSVELVVHVVGELAYLLSTSRGEAQMIEGPTGAPVGDPIALGALRGVVGFAVRAGVLYVTLWDEEQATLLIAEPGLGVRRRVLPGDSAPGIPQASADGVWVPMQSDPRLWFSDPTGREALVSLDLPDGYTRQGWLTVVGDRGYLVHIAEPRALLELDLAEGRFLRERLRADATCTVQHPVAWGEHLYLACRNQNAVARLGPEQIALVGADRLALRGGPQVRAMKLAVHDQGLVALHAQTNFFSRVRPERFDLPLGHPDREAAAQPIAVLSPVVFDLVARARQALALESREDGSAWLSSVEPVSGAIQWRRRQAAGTRFVGFDMADDLSIDLGRL